MFFVGFVVGALVGAAVGVTAMAFAVASRRAPVPKVAPKPTTAAAREPVVPSVQPARGPSTPAVAAGPEADSGPDRLPDPEPAT